jgi:tRNA pseudouridine38-40 synthase
MKYIKMIIEYDGTNYQGWQTQRSGLTVQDILCKTISDITGERIDLNSASRTDAGVHALGQVAVFSTGSRLSAGTLKRALNARLPEDMRILWAEELDCEFHPRYRAVKKSYFYLIEETQRQSVFFHRYSWRIPVSLDLGRMIEASAFLHGEHDFSAFRGTGCGAKTTVRTIHSITLARYDHLDFMTARIQGNFIKIRLEADAFLRHMVRNIVGTLIEVGKGRSSPAAVMNILMSRDRKLAGPTAPAKGLFLEKIYF